MGILLLGVPQGETSRLVLVHGERPLVSLSAIPLTLIVVLIEKPYPFDYRIGLTLVILYIFYEWVNEPAAQL